MALPARPFTGRLLTEIARFDGGVPAAAAAMGIAPQAVDALAKGHVPSPGDLEAIYTWLAQRTTLTEQEIEDYEGIRETAFRPQVVQVERMPPGGEPPISPTRPSLPSRPQVIAGLAILLLSIVVTVVVTTAIVTSGTGGTATTTAQPSAVRSSQTPPLAASTSPIATGTAPATPKAPIAAPPTKVFSGHLSIAYELAGSDRHYKDLKVNPPVTTTDESKADVYLTTAGTSDQIVRMEVVVDSGATVGMWNKPTAPTYSECLETAQSAGVPEIDIKVGQRVCVKTSSGSVASLKLVSINDMVSGDFVATVWYVQTSPGASP